MFKLNSYIIIFVSLFFLLNCSGGKEEKKRPNDPWVFRSVLDGKPRMLTLALDTNLWISYSTEKCVAYKAWYGNVKFDGAVYTTAHGPQPTTAGNTYFENELESPWLVEKEGKEVKIKAQYKGHKLNKGKVSLMYSLEYAPGKNIQIEESPEFVSFSDKSPGLERTFKVSGIPEGMKVKLKLDLENVPSDDRHLTNGTYKHGEETEVKAKNKQEKDRKVKKGILELKANESTRFTAYFDKNILYKKPEEKLAGNIIALFEQSGCYSCHNPNEKAVGPAYAEIAKKYKMIAGNVDYLTTKVIQGGAGNWGKVAMNPHPQLKKDDIVKMVEYILLMNEENRKAVNEADKTTGMAFTVYQLWEEWKNIQALPKDIKPYRSFKSRGGWFEFKDALPVSGNFLVKGKARLNVRQSQNFLFQTFTQAGGIQVKIDNKVVVDDPQIKNNKSEKQGEMTLEPGEYDIELSYFCNELPEYSNISSGLFEFSVYLNDRKFFTPWYPAGLITFKEEDISQKTEIPIATYSGPKIPGDGIPLESVHPSFDLSQARPDNFQPRIGGMDFLSDGKLVVSTWDSLGAVYILDNLNQPDHNKITYKRIAFGLAEPLGLKVVGKDIYVLQKQELTRLVDTNGDQIIDEYQTVCNGWTAAGNFHEFAFGLAYKESHFYFALAIAIEPGGKSTKPQLPDRGKIIKVNNETGAFEFVSQGLRTPNGIGIGVDNEIFVADNQGDWLPSCKIMHVRQGAFFGSRAVDSVGTANLKENPPVVWLPQDEIGNSPSQPAIIQAGPYAGQMIHGEVTHGGIKRVFVEKINGNYQGAVFRFIQGLEAGVNRIIWGPDGQLYVGQIGVSGNWGHMTTKGMGKFGLQRLKYNKKSAFEMLAVRAKSNGMEIEFTEPLQAGDGINTEDYLVKQWWYKPTENYGGPKMDEEKLNVKSASVSDDRKKVSLEIEGMKEGRVIYIRLMNHYVSAQNNELWSTEAWYTLNNIPKNANGLVSVQKYTAPKDNELSVNETKNGWKLLFDGKTTDGWRNYGKKSIGSNWKAENGTLTLSGDKNEKGNFKDGGDIICEDEFENFELQLEWKISKAGNSGIFYNVVENQKYKAAYLTGPEMQVLDNAKHPDARFIKHRAGDLYDLIECKFVTVKPAGEWNKVRLVVNKGKVEHWLNGHKVVEYQLWTEEWNKLVAGSKFKDMPDFGKARKGRIALQDHQDQVSYKNIKIKKL